MSLHYDWNWVRFYEQQPSAPMTLNAERLAEHEATLEALRGLSFEAGLSVIANSVPHMSDDVWADWYELLREDAAQHYRFAAWSRLGDTICNSQAGIEQLLTFPIRDAVREADRLMEQLTPVEQFAHMAILKHFAPTTPKAQVLFFYLLRSTHDYTTTLHPILRFYNRLTPRQQDVAALVAYGYTNQEISEELLIVESVVAEHLTTIYEKFDLAIAYTGSSKGTRYRLIHLLTRLFIEYPELLALDIHA